MDSENLNKLLQDPRFEKVVYAVLQHLINKNNKSNDLFVLHVDIANSKFEIRNLQSSAVLNITTDNKECEKILGQKYFVEMRDYLIAFIQTALSMKLDIDKIYDLAKTNKKAELQNALDSLVLYQKRRTGSEPIQKNKRSSISNQYSRYCGACQESPCMCSDPDPG